MVKPFKKPKIVISKCIEFDNCRYNSQIISSDFVKKLKKEGIKTPKIVLFRIVCLIVAR